MTTALPELHAIQWLPGAGQEETILHWVQLIRRIRRAGKNALVYADARDMPALIGEVAARGMCIGTSCASGQAARDLLDMVTRL